MSNRPLFSCHSIAVKESMGSKDQQQYRTLSFPAQRSVGTLISGHRNSADGIETDWQPCWNAQGTVEIANSYALLQLNWNENEHDLAPLLKLKPDDLAILWLTSSDVSWLNDVVAGPISHLSGLEQLGLSHSAVTDAVFKHLAALTSLRKLHLRNTRITGRGLDLLSADTINGLDLSNTQLDDVGFHTLPRFRVLRALNLAELKDTFTNGALSNVLKIPSLECLILHRLKCILKDILTGLDQLPCLSDLALGQTDIDDDELLVLRGPASLKILDLSYTAIKGHGLQSLHWLPNLEELLLANTDVTDIALCLLEHTPKLQTLELGRTKITDAGLPALQRLKCLRRLILDSASFTNKGLQHLEQMQDLEQLSLGGADLSDLSLGSLQHLSKLTMLNLYTKSGQITDAGLSCLTGLHNLKQLVLSPTTITDAGLLQLYELDKLQTLMIQSPAVSDAGVARLQAALPECSISISR